jgi:hypothetical protein
MSISFECEPFSSIRGSAIEALKQSNFKQVWIALLPPLPTISNEFMELVPPSSEENLRWLSTSTIVSQYLKRFRSNGVTAKLPTLENLSAISQFPFHAARKLKPLTGMTV